MGGSKQAVPQYAGSDLTSFFGSMYVDIQDTTIQLLPRARTSALWQHCARAATSASPAVTLRWTQSSSDPSSANPGFQDGSNYGFKVDAIGLKAVTVQRPHRQWVRWYLGRRSFSVDCR